MSACWCVVFNVHFILSFGQKYIFINETISGADANNLCLDRSGTTLASIHSAADNIEAQALCTPLTMDEKQECWIGLHDFDMEARNNKTLFKWYDGTAVDYHNWADGQPDDQFLDSQHAEDLVTIASDSGQWNDQQNIRVLRVICWHSSYAIIDPVQKSTLNTALPESSEATSDANHVKPEYIAIICIVVLFGCLCMFALHFFLYVRPNRRKKNRTKTHTGKKSKEKIKRVEIKVIESQQGNDEFLSPKSSTKNAADASLAVNPRTLRLGNNSVFSDDTHVTNLSSASMSFDTQTAIGSEYTATVQHSVWKNFVEEDVLLHADEKP